MCGAGPPGDAQVTSPRGWSKLTNRRAGLETSPALPTAGSGRTLSRRWYVSLVVTTDSSRLPWPEQGEEEGPCGQ